MRHKGRTMLAALVAVFAVGALAAASASAALPEFVPNGSGAEPVSFKAELGSRVTLVRKEALPVICERRSASASGFGKITGAKEISGLTLSFEHCSENGDPEYPCYNRWSEGVEGERTWIETEALTGTLGYVQKEPTKVVGLKLQGPKATESAEPTFAKTVTCYTPLIVKRSKAPITGVVYGSVASINKLGKTITVAYEQSNAEQKIKHFEGELTGGGELNWPELTGGTPDPTALEGVDTLSKFERAKKVIEVEVKA